MGSPMKTRSKSNRSCSPTSSVSSSRRTSESSGSQSLPVHQHFTRRALSLGVRKRLENESPASSRSSIETPPPQLHNECEDGDSSSSNSTIRHSSRLATKRKSSSYTPPPLLLPMSIDCMSVSSHSSRSSRSDEKVPMKRGKALSIDQGPRYQECERLLKTGKRLKVDVEEEEASNSSNSVFPSTDGQPELRLVLPGDKQWLVQSSSSSTNSEKASTERSSRSSETPTPAAQPSPPLGESQLVSDPLPDKISGRDLNFSAKDYIIATQLTMRLYKTMFSCSESDPAGTRLARPLLVRNLPWHLNSSFRPNGSSLYRFGEEAPSKLWSARSLRREKQPEKSNFEKGMRVDAVATAVIARHTLQAELQQRLGTTFKFSTGWLATYDESGKDVSVLVDCAKFRRFAEFSGNNQLSTFIRGVLAKRASIAKPASVVSSPRVSRTPSPNKRFVGLEVVLASQNGTTTKDRTSALSPSRLNSVSKNGARSDSKETTTKLCGSSARKKTAGAFPSPSKASVCLNGSRTTEHLGMSTPAQQLDGSAHQKHNSSPSKKSLDATEEWQPSLERTRLSLDMTDELSVPGSSITSNTLCFFRVNHKHLTGRRMCSIDLFTSIRSPNGSFSKPKPLQGSVTIDIENQITLKHPLCIDLPGDLDRVRKGSQVFLVVRAAFSDDLTSHVVNGRRIRNVPVKAESDDEESRPSSKHSFSQPSPVLPSPVPPSQTTSPRRGRRRLNDGDDLFDKPVMYGAVEIFRTESSKDADEGYSYGSKSIRLIDTHEAIQKKGEWRSDESFMPRLLPLVKKAHMNPFIMMELVQEEVEYTPSGSSLSRHSSKANTPEPDGSSASLNSHCGMKWTEPEDVRQAKNTVDVHHLPVMQDMECLPRSFIAAFLGKRAIPSKMLAGGDATYRRHIRALEKHCKLPMSTILNDASLREGVNQFMSGAFPDLIVYRFAGAFMDEESMEECRQSLVASKPQPMALDIHEDVAEDYVPVLQQASHPPAMIVGHKLNVHSESIFQDINDDPIPYYASVCSKYAVRYTTSRRLVALSTRIHPDKFSRIIRNIKAFKKDPNGPLRMLQKFERLWLRTRDWSWQLEEVDKVFSADSLTPLFYESFYGADGEFILKPVIRMGSGKMMAFLSPELADAFRRDVLAFRLSGRYCPPSWFPKRLSSPSSPLLPLSQPPLDRHLPSLKIPLDLAPFKYWSELATTRKQGQRLFLKEEEPESDSSWEEDLDLSVKQEVAEAYSCTSSPSKLMGSAYRKQGTTGIFLPGRESESGDLTNKEPSNGDTAASSPEAILSWPQRFSNKIASFPLFKAACEALGKRACASPEKGNEAVKPAAEKAKGKRAADAEEHAEPDYKKFKPEPLSPKEELEYDLLSYFGIPFEEYSLPYARRDAVSLFMAEQTPSQQMKIRAYWAGRKVNLNHWSKRVWEDDEEYDVLLKKVKILQAHGFQIIPPLFIKDVKQMRLAVRKRGISISGLAMTNSRLGTRSGIPRQKKVIKRGPKEIFFNELESTTPNQCIICLRRFSDMFALMMHYTLSYPRLNFQLQPQLTRGKAAGAEEKRNELYIQVTLESDVDMTLELVQPLEKLDILRGHIMISQLRRISKAVRVQPSEKAVFLCTSAESFALSCLMRRDMTLFIDRILTPENLRRLDLQLIAGACRLSEAVMWGQKKRTSYADGPGGLNPFELKSFLHHRLTPLMESDAPFVDRAFNCLWTYHLEVFPRMNRICAPYMTIRLFMRVSGHLIRALSASSHLLRLCILHSHLLTEFESDDLMHRCGMFFGAEAEKLPAEETPEAVGKHDPFFDKDSPLYFRTLREAIDIYEKFQSRLNKKRSRYSAPFTERDIPKEFRRDPRVMDDSSLRHLFRRMRTVAGAEMVVESEIEYFFDSEEARDIPDAFFPTLQALPPPPDGVELPKPRFICNNSSPRFYSDEFFNARRKYAESLERRHTKQAVSTAISSASLPSSSIAWAPAVPGSPTKHAALFGRSKPAY